MGRIQRHLPAWARGRAGRAGFAGAMGISTGIGNNKRCGVTEEESGSTSHIRTTGRRHPNPSTFRVGRLTVHSGISER